MNYDYCRIGFLTTILCCVIASCGCSLASQSSFGGDDCTYHGEGFCILGREPSNVDRREQADFLLHIIMMTSEFGFAVYEGTAPDFQGPVTDKIENPTPDISMIELASQPNGRAEILVRYEVCETYAGSPCFVHVIYNRPNFIEYFGGDQVLSMFRFERAG